MNISKGMLAVVVCAAALAGAVAQSATDGVKWIWDSKLEAVNAAPNIHKVLFENDHLRLLEVTIHAGETEPMHGHMYPSIFAYDAPQPKLINVQLDGSTANIDRNKMGLTYPTCRSMPIQAPHRVTIDDSFQQHFYRVEFKKMDGDAILNRK